MARIVGAAGRRRVRNSRDPRPKKRMAGNGRGAHPSGHRFRIARRLTSMDTRSRPLGMAALLLATAAWGGMFLVSKGALRHVDPVWVTLIRYSLSGLLFGALLLPRGIAPWRKLRTHAGPLAVRGLAGFGVFSVMLLIGLAHSVPSHGAIIMATTPMTTQLARWVLDGIRPARATLLTGLVALAG